MKLHRLQPPATRLGRTIWPGLRRALPIAAALLIGSALPTFGQAGLGQLAVRSDGFIFWIENGVRHVVYPVSLSDEQINALPEGIPLNASLQPDLGPTLLLDELVHVRRGPLHRPHVVVVGRQARHLAQHLERDRQLVGVDAGGAAVVLLLAHRRSVRSRARSPAIR